MGLPHDCLRPPWHPNLVWRGWKGGETIIVPYPNSPPWHHTPNARFSATRLASPRSGWCLGVIRQSYHPTPRLSIEKGAGRLAHPDSAERHAGGFLTLDLRVQRERPGGIQHVLWLLLRQVTCEVTRCTCFQNRRFSDHAQLADEVHNQALIQRLREKRELGSWQLAVPFPSPCLPTVLQVIGQTHNGCMTNSTNLYMSLNRLMDHLRAPKNMRCRVSLMLLGNAGLSHSDLVASSFGMRWPPLATRLVGTKE